MGLVRPFAAIVKATALEILSEPFSLLMLLAASALSVLAPVFHYHQFGEVTRMAREAGLSTILVFGLILGVFSSVRSFRREIESGTYQMALAHPVSTRLFFYSKFFGVLASYVVFVAILFGLLVTTVLGAEVGGEIAEREGGLSSVWGPCVAAAVASFVVPIVVGALLNRSLRMRFVLTSILTMLVLSAASAVVFSCMRGFGWMLRFLPVIALLVAFTSFVIAVASVAALRMKANAASSITALVALVMLPFVGNYYAVDALADGGSVGLGYFLAALGAIVPAIGACLILGVPDEHYRA